MEPITTTSTGISEAGDTQTASPLDRFTPGHPGNVTPAVRLQPTGEAVVVLERRDENIVEVYLRGEIAEYHPEVLATPITDPALRAELLGEAIAATAADRRALQVRHQSLKAMFEVERADRHDTMANVRRYVIERGHLEGHICADGLNEFLTEFGLDEYDPRTRVHFTITGSYEVTGNADADSAADQAHYHLQVDFDDVPDIDIDTTSFTVTVDSAEGVGTGL